MSAQRCLCQRDDSAEGSGSASLLFDPRMRFLARFAFQDSNTTNFALCSMLAARPAIGDARHPSPSPKFVTLERRHRGKHEIESMAITITDLRKKLGDPSKSEGGLYPIAGKRDTSAAGVMREWPCGCWALTPYAARADIEDLPTQYTPCEKHEREL